MHLEKVAVRQILNVFLYDDPVRCTESLSAKLHKNYTNSTSDLPWHPECDKYTGKLNKLNVNSELT